MLSIPGAQFVLLRRTMFTGAYEPRLENLVTNPYNRRENCENPHQQAPETVLGSKSPLHRRLDAWLRARISSLIKALTRAPTPSIILASDCVENVYVGSSQDPIPRSSRLRGLTSCLWSRNAPAICPSSAPLDLLDVGPRQPRVHPSRLRRPASDFHVGGLRVRGARAVRVVYALARRVAHETRSLYGGSLAARREVGVHDAQGYAEEKPPLEIGNDQSLKACVGPPLVGFAFLRLSLWRTPARRRSWPGLAGRVR
jgi:hypothetical protein